MKEYENRQTVFSRLGLDFDLFEGIYASAWKGSCRFLELARTPVCCGVSRNHRLAKASGLSMQDLSGEVLVMPGNGLTDEAELVPAAFSGAEVELVAVRKHEKECVLVFRVHIKEGTQPFKGFGGDMPAADRHGQRVFREAIARLAICSFSVSIRPQ